MKMFEKIWYLIDDFLYDVRTLLSNDRRKWEHLTFELTDIAIDPPCKCEEKNEVKDTDFYIEEWFDSKERKVKFSVYKNLSGAALGKKFCCGSFDTFSEAKEVLVTLRKYKKPIIYYC